MSAVGLAELNERLRALRESGSLQEARSLLRAMPGFATSPTLQRLAHEHEDFWWKPIRGRRIALARRGPDDAAFIRACWSDAGFMRKFNRLARPLPAEDAVLRQILARERACILSETRELHWTIRAAHGPIGFIGATDYVQQHRRCEFLIGLLHDKSSPLALEAALLAMDFLRGQAGIERLTAYFYPDNTHAINVARKFGFEIEGTLRGYMRESDGSRSDLVVAGLVLDGAHGSKWRQRIASEVR